MKTRFLFPYWCKYLGVILFLVHLPVVLLYKSEVIFKSRDAFPQMSPDDPGVFSMPHVFFVVTTVFMVLGLVLFAFSKEKTEDEQIAQLRMDSLQWAVYLSYIFLIICLAVTSSKQDIKDILRMHIWVPLLIFIVLFRFKMYRNSRYTKEDAV